MIKLDIIGIPSDASNKEEIYTDLHLDSALNFTNRNELEKRLQVSDLQIDKNVGAIRNSIINILTTNPGEKILNPLFGVGFGNLLFLPATEERASVIGNNILSNLSKFEPRIKIINLEITPITDLQEYICDITYIIPRFNNQKLELKGNLSQSGFYV